MVTAELSKEFKANSSGTMVDTTGRTVRVANSGFDVATDGKMVAVANGTEEVGTVSTEKARKERSLHSALADKYFDALDEITVHSERGHKLNLKIHGFARVPLLGARCGSVVLLFPAMDGHLTLDSTDLSLHGNLDSSFKNAGFELAVGGAGRRLQGVKSTHGFFDHVDAAAAAGWRCEGVPLPKTPKTSSHSAVRYTPCSQSGLGCDSKYGGHIAGAVSIPSHHAAAVASRLANIRRILVDEDLEASKVRFSQVMTTKMQSPSYEVQFDVFPNHPKQEKVDLFNTLTKKSVSFQRMSGSLARAYCEEGKAQVSNSDVNRSLHMEFMGIAGEEDGRMYRHWRVMPAEAFRKWILNGETAKGKEYFEFWDDAESFAPRRLLDGNGALTAYGPWTDGVTDSDVEAELGEAAAYSVSCDDDEKAAFHPAFGTVPHVMSQSHDLSLADLDFYVQELATDIASSRNATIEKDEAWGAMKAVPTSDSMSSFAAYALRSKELFPMPDACADACAETLADARNAAGVNGAGALCGSPQLLNLQECFGALAQPLVQKCVQSHFNLVIMQRCNQEARSVEEDAEVGVLADGTQAVDLDSLANADRQSLNAGIPEAGRDGARLLVNASSVDATAVVDASGSGRRMFLEWCGNVLFPLCIKLAFPWKCKEPKEALKSFDYAGKIITSVKSFTKNVKLSKAGIKNLLKGMKVQKNTESCKFYLKVLIAVSWDTIPKIATKTAVFCISVILGGEFNALTVFAIPDPPIYGNLYANGGLLISTVAACPGKVKFTFEGFIEIGFALGLDLLPGLLPSIDLLNLSLKGGAKTQLVKGYKTRKDVSRRRSPCAGCRRRGWGNWSRRRGAQWKWTTYPETCEVVIYVKVTLTLLSIIRGWVLYEYFVFSGGGRLTVGVDYYEVWKLFWGNWVTAVECVLVTHG